MSAASPCLLSVLALYGLSAFAHAAAIVWSPATTISGPSDVSTNGLLDRAFNFGAPGVSSATINGVTFSPFATNGSSSITVGNTMLSSPSAMNGTSEVGFAAAPFSSLSADYQNLLANSIFGSAADTLTLTLSGLTAGQIYEFQWWVNDSRASAGSNRQGIATATNAVTLEYNSQNADGGLGQFAIGTFTADGTSQAVTFVGASTGPPGAAPQINGFQLRVIPEPSSAILSLIGAWPLFRRVRRKR